MSVDDVNSLRPGDKVVYVAAKRRTLGTVRNIWRGDMLTVKWSDGAIDSFVITEDTARHLERHGEG